MLPDARDQHRDDGGGGGRRVGETGRGPAVGDPSEPEVIEEDVARLGLGLGLCLGLGLGLGLG